MLPLSVSLCSTAPPKGEPSGLLRIRPGLRKTAATYRNPLSQAVRPASSPIGEPGASLPPLGEVPRSGKGGDGGWLRAVHITTQPGTPPLRLAKSRLTAVARLHSACASLSQPLRAASSSTGEPRMLTPRGRWQHRPLGCFGTKHMELLLLCPCIWGRYLL